MMKNRVLYFDVLNIVACLSVVFMHCNGIAHTYSNTLAWKQALLVEVCGYWAVPVFLMLTGATLLGYRERYSTVEFYKKRIVKTVIPFVFWSVFTVFLLHLDITGWTLSTWINKIVLSEMEPVYWFFIPLFFVYLFIPALALVKEDASLKTMWSLFLIMFLINSVFPIVFPKVGFSFNYSLPFPYYYLLFPIIGYLIANTDFVFWQRLLIYLLGIFSAIFRYAETYILSTKSGIIDKTYFSYIQFHSVLLAMAVFLLFKQINWDKIFTTEKSKQYIKTISSCSFGIYLIHKTLMRIATSEYVGINNACWEWRILAPFVLYFVALLLVLLMKRIPIIKRIVP